VTNSSNPDNREFRKPSVPSGAPKEQSLAEALYRRYGRLVGFLLRIFDIPQSHRNDLFNQIFMNVTRGLQHVKHYGNMKAWVTKIAKNEIFQFMKKNKNEEKVRAIRTRQINSERVTCKSGLLLFPIELEVYNDQVMTALNRCIDQLDEQLKLPFLLRYRDNLKWHEISQRLNLNKDTARKRVSKARKLITRRLRDEIESNREQADSATS
jgi:RNA polymerase sigma-70 factor (ECF subfamily)